MKKILKTFCIAILCGLGLFQVGTPQKEITLAKPYSYINKIQGGSEVVLTNSNLRSQICQLLGKTSNSKLYSDDFLNSDDYKATTTTNPDTGLSETTANKNYLDLSYLNIKDLMELCQFEFPQTLNGISLMGNKISNEDLPNLVKFLSLNKSMDTITIGEQTYKIRSNFDEVIKKINLNYNLIDLRTTSSEYLANDKLLFGLQNLNETYSLCLPEEQINLSYYIRTNDENYLSYNLYYNNSRQPLSINTIKTLGTDVLGDYKIEIAGTPNSTSGYFHGLNISKEFTLFTLKIKDTFKVERKQLFDLDLSKDGTNYILNGIGRNVCTLDLTPRTNTDTAGIGHTAVKITYAGKTRTVSLPFVIVDTISPEIKLDGYSTMYWRQFKEWKDPGYSGWDSGDNLTNSVKVDRSELDETVCGTYLIKYSLEDLSGNATSTTRTIIVQESVLDEIKISTTKDKFNVGEEIFLSVEPAPNTPISKYKDYVYTWYLDGVEFKTTKGDAVTAKSTTILVLDNSLSHKITVTLKAKQIADDREVLINSEEFEIKCSLSVTSQKGIMFALCSAVTLIAIITLTVTISKSKKAKKLSQKSKSKNNSKQENITVIKDYNQNKPDDKNDNKK